jgi:hypothetical protein
MDARAAGGGMSAWGGGGALAGTRGWLALPSPAAPPWLRWLLPGGGGLAGTEAWPLAPSAAARSWLRWPAPSVA